MPQSRAVLLWAIPLAVSGSVASCNPDGDDGTPEAGRGGTAAAGGRGGRATGGSGGHQTQGGAPSGQGGESEAAGIAGEGVESAGDGGGVAGEGDAGEGGAHATETVGTGGTGGSGGTSTGNGGRGAGAGGAAGGGTGGTGIGTVGGASGTAGTTGGRAGGSASGATGGAAGDGAELPTSCAVDHGGCDTLSACTDGPEGPICGACPSGFDGDGASGCVPHPCAGPPDPSCACIKVAVDGDDTLGASSNGLAPFQTVQAAIDFADGHRNHARAVCVAAGTFAGPSDADLRMRDGISVYGGYESSSWTATSLAPTTLAPVTANGVVFGPDVQSTTELSGFNVTLPATDTTTGVTISGARGARVSSVYFHLSALPTNYCGVDVSGDAVALLHGLQMYPGGWDDLNGTPGEAIGVRVSESHVTIDGSTYVYAMGSGTVVGLSLTNASASVSNSTFVAGGDPTPATLTGLRVRNGREITLARSSFLAGTGWYTAMAPIATGIDIEDTPEITLDNASGGTNAQVSTGVRIVRSKALFSRGGGSGTIGIDLVDASGSKIDAGGSGRSATVVPVEAFGLRVTGDATGVEITGGTFNVDTTVGGASVAFYDCGDTTPLLTGASITATTWASFDGIRSQDCRARIRSNQVAVTARNMFDMEYRGIRCSVSPGSTARCTVTDNDVTLTAPPSFNGDHSWPTIWSAAVEGDIESLTGNRLSALMVVSDGEISGSHSHVPCNINHYGTGAFGGSGAIVRGGGLVSGNLIVAGCSGDGAGLEASGRIENNVIVGPVCNGPTPPPAYSLCDGLRLNGDAVVHSNTIFGGKPATLDPNYAMPPWNYSPPAPCASTGMTIGTNQAVVRNNIIEAGLCQTGAAVQAPATSPPSVFENNDMLGAWPGTNPPTGNFSADPLLDASYRLKADSPCIDTGTGADAPLTDRDGDVRDAHPDVGADERSACAVANGGCDPVTTCHGLAVGVACGPCPSGYTGDGATACTDIDECLAGTDDCPVVEPGSSVDHTSAACVNKPGGWDCVCPSGFHYSDSTNQYGDRFQSCDDINECFDGNWGGCGTADCINTPGGYHCSECPAGFTSTEHGCIDVDECATDNGGCQTERCTNTPGGHRCSACYVGYQSTDHGCVDLDECAAGIDGCDPGACINDPGSFHCDCPTGYTSTGQSCRDLNECTSNNGGCDPLTTCANTLGGRTCSGCPAGYTGTGETGCVDIDECATNNGGCGIAACTNTPGGRTCQCPAGYTSTDQGCVDIDECATNNGGCDRNTTCTNTPGARACSACPLDMTGDGETGCVDPAPVDSLCLTEFIGCAVRRSGRLECWGTVSEYGDMPSATERFTSVSCYGSHVCALRTDHTVVCWGNPTAPTPAGAFDSVSAGGWHDCGLRPGGSIECWGSDVVGTEPAPAGLFEQVSSGELYSCAVGVDHAVTCWGDDQWGGGTDIPPDAFQSVSAVSGTCGIRLDGTLACWGGTFLAGWQEPPPEGRFLALSTGFYGSCAIAEDQTLNCFGRDWFDGASTPSGTFRLVTRGSINACGVRTDDSVVCWGDNSMGESDAPPH